MRRKIDVTAAEMLQLREQGMSNHDIAASLDISVATVRRYIGSQGGHMEGYSAFKNTPTRRKTEAKEDAPVLPKYNPKPSKEEYVICDYSIELNNDDRLVTVSAASGDIVLAYEDIPDLVQFLAWAMRERMSTPESEDYAHGA
jgi:AcrR family transcriptional regulator